MAMNITMKPTTPPIIGPAGTIGEAPGLEDEDPEPGTTGTALVPIAEVIAVLEIVVEDSVVSCCN